MTRDVVIENPNHDSLSRRQALKAFAGMTAGAIGVLMHVGQQRNPLLSDAAAANAAGNYQYQRLSNPSRSIVTDSQGTWLGIFTDGAYTATLAGSSRTFSEPTATHGVTTSAWVRVLPQPFTGNVDEGWLGQELADQGPDLFALAMQYIMGAAPILDATGLQIAGEAGYGPLLPNGKRDETADFYEYLGVPWTFGTQVEQPQADQFRDVDCSGYMRMIWGYRSGLPLTLRPSQTAIPRHSWDIAKEAPGPVVIVNAGQQPTDFSSLNPGDLLFFDLQNDGGIDHVGMYLDKDDAGHYRFISSRQTENGPTMGDKGGVSILDGGGYYAKAFRSARRL